MKFQGNIEAEAASTPNTAAGNAAVEDLARRIAYQAPDLASLTPEQLETIARAVVGQRLVRDLDQKATIAGIEYQTERTTFLEQAGRTKSLNTRKAYAHALARLESFAERSGIVVLALKAKDADDFAYALAKEGRSSASVRLDIAAASSFYTFLERRTEGRVANPFRGSKARPAKKSTRMVAIPSADEAMTILDALPPEIRAAAAVMRYRGLRVGALPGLTVWGGRFAGHSKGKDIAGDLPSEAIEAIRAANLHSRTPFAGSSETRIADAIRRETKRLAATGKIAAPYSAHDFRHLYATTEYRKDKDIYRVSKLLGHASIQVTELYLKGLGEVG